MNDKKLYGDERREQILDWLKESKEALTGKELSVRTNVSRQVIVQDMSLLKAKGHPIIATSNGYLYMQTHPKEKHQRLIACQHQPTDAMDELYTLVDYGVKVINVIVEHPMYGELTASLHFHTRQQVQQFNEEMKATNATLLSELTNGVHLHTIEADTPKQLEDAISALRKKGYLLED
ncbi:transcription repressor NadR [Alkalihalophilus pseudofirmus]|uniref:Transcription repressor NadR n=1 Tax=Alkalihalophilus pseudofirmus TaxID=79885 RepID=A0AAJ2NRD6_ALKPS|nr:MULTISPECIES: transcription repressor NadR [Alkalihalophilus]MDV2886927.1 transcription repressor NadR [Alkalihalophilus pseudofirmus]MED1600660.1 transcription repressor NadR [Alkalihalophilus marmarensis]OLS36605.1 transcription repressor NadR [Alkalihalophilus pseudofirmus]WEG17664.1 transcription repressor NadR [Alkalihalophilus pseudofirmus]